MDRLSIKRHKSGRWSIHIYCPVYRTSFYVYPDTTDKDYGEVLDAWGAPASLGRDDFYKCAARQVSFNGRLLLFLRTKSPAPVVAHECIHLVNAAFGARGITYTQDEDEHFAYYVQWLMETIDTGLAELEAKKHKRDQAQNGIASKS